MLTAVPQSASKVTPKWPQSDPKLNSLNILAGANSTEEEIYLLSKTKAPQWPAVGINWTSLISWSFQLPSPTPSRIKSFISNVIGCQVEEVSSRRERYRRRHYGPKIRHRRDSSKMPSRRTWRSVPEAPFGRHLTEYFPMKCYLKRPARKQNYRRDAIKENDGGETCP